MTTARTMRKRNACGTAGRANEGPSSARTGSETSSAVSTVPTLVRAMRSRPRITAAASATTTSRATAAAGLRVAAAATTAVRTAPPASSAASPAGSGRGRAVRRRRVSGAGVRARRRAQGHGRILAVRAGGRRLPGQAVEERRQLGGEAAELVAFERGRVRDRRRAAADGGDEGGQRSAHGVVGQHAGAAADLGEEPAGGGAGRRDGEDRPAGLQVLEHLARHALRPAPVDQQQRVGGALVAERDRQRHERLDAHAVAEAEPVGVRAHAALVDADEQRLDVRRQRRERLEEGGDLLLAAVQPAGVDDPEAVAERDVRRLLGAVEAVGEHVGAAGSHGCRATRSSTIGRLTAVTAAARPAPTPRGARGRPCAPRVGYLRNWYVDHGSR